MRIAHPSNFITGGQRLEDRLDKLEGIVNHLAASSILHLEFWRDIKVDWDKMPAEMKKVADEIRLTAVNKVLAGR